MMVVNWIREYKALIMVVSYSSSTKIVSNINLHVLEAAEAGHQRSTPFLDDLEHTADIRRPTGKWCSNRCFCLGKRETDVRGLQRCTVICAVTAHKHCVSEALQPLDDFVLLIRRHTCEDLGFDEHLKATKSNTF